MEELDSYEEFLALHRPQLFTSGVPEHFWPTLFEKLLTENFDAGETFSLVFIDYGDAVVDETEPIFTLYISKAGGILANNAKEIYLIDHAWTFKANQARADLEQVPSLTHRMCTVIGVNPQHPNRIERILKFLWKYCQAYSIEADNATIEERMPIWYMMDEVGTAVNHSDQPNFRIVPFIYLPNQTTYSLLFPIRNCVEGETVYRDFVENVPDFTKERRALLLPWQHCDFKEENFVQFEPDEDYFVQGHIPETMPNSSLIRPELNRDEPIKVYSEYDVLTANLTAPYFEIVDNEESADILWLIKHFKNYEELNRDTPNKFINQFPYEYVLTIKDLLSIVCRRRSERHHYPETLETCPKWLPTTYNLKTELHEFVSYFQNREARHLDNHWIIKPWNLARGLGMDITSNLWKILRLQTTGPKIAQKYIANPVLFHRSEIDCKVKFDIRYVILLKSVQPLEAYIHTKFYLRFANQIFSLDRFEDYEKHFTVMNYTENAELRHIKCEEFLIMWKEQYPQFQWELIETEICEMLNEVLLCATQKKLPCGIANCPQSRAIYAADIILAWEENNGPVIQPKLLEINWMPDCKRACEYYPEFFNDCFKLLFLNEIDLEQFRLITKPDGA